MDRCKMCGGQLDTAYRCLACGDDNTPQHHSWRSSGTAEPKRCIKCSAVQEPNWHKFCPYCGGAFNR